MSQAHVTAARPAHLSPPQPHGALEAGRAGQLEEVGRVFRGGIPWMAFAPEGDLLILCGGAIERLCPDTLTLRGRWEPLPGLTAFEPLTDGRFLLLANRADASTLAVGRFGEDITVLHEASNRLTCATCTPDGQSFVVPIDTGVVLLDGSGAQVGELTAPSDAFNGPRSAANGIVRISACGGFVARWEPMKRGHIWSTETGETQNFTWYRGDTPRSSTIEVESAAFFGVGQALVNHGSGRFYVHDLSDQSIGPTRGGLDLGIGPPCIVDQQAVFADGYGGFFTRGLDTWEEGRAGKGHDKHYGSQHTSHRPVAANGTHVASYAGTFGELHVHGPGGTAIRTDHFPRLESLSADTSGRRLVLKSAHRNSAIYVDREAATVRHIETSEGIEGPAISDDGQHLLFAAGANLKPRQMMVASAEGDEPPVATHKSMPFSGGTLSFGGTYYAHCGYNLNNNGWIGLFEVGKKRAATKVKAYARHFSVSRDGSTLALTGDWRKRLGEVFDLSKKGAKLESLTDTTQVVLGTTREAMAFVQSADKSSPHTLHIRPHGLAISVPPGRREMAFSEDDTLLFIAHPDGIHAIDTQSGEALAQLPLPGPTVAMLARGDQLFVLGEDAVVRVFATPGGADAVAKRPEPVAVVALEEEPEVLLPSTVPWPPRGAPIVLSLGQRTLEIRRTEAAAKLFIDGKAHKSLRKHKSDDPGRFEHAKAVWAARRKNPMGQSVTTELAEALRTGRSATGSELQALLTHEAYQRTLWQRLDGEQTGSYRDGALRDLNGNAWSPDSDQRYRLVHPARLDDEALSAWHEAHPDLLQLNATLHPVHIPPSSNGTEVQPVPTGWAKTQNKTVVLLLEGDGYERHLDSGQADHATILLAPELGAVVLVALDTEHGCSTLSFQAWNGTRDGGDALPFEQVDPQLYSEAFASVVGAYPHDR